MVGVGAMVQPTHKLLDANRSSTIYAPSTGSRTRHLHLAADSASRQLKDAKVSLVRVNPLIVLAGRGFLGEGAVLTP